MSVPLITKKYTNLPTHIPTKSLAAPNKLEQGLSVIESFKKQSLIYLVFSDCESGLKTSFGCVRYENFIVHFNINKYTLD